MYQALYRKWRPKTFSDVIGQSHITQTLKKQVAEGRTSHAYLFTGTRGTGKTTCAKILAKAVNCEHPVDGDPCCQCPACRRYSRAYIRHLLKAKEMLGMRLCVLHNLYFYNTMMAEIREAIDAGRYQAYKKEKLDKMKSGS